MRDGILRAAQCLHRAGAWIFDRSGPVAPALAFLDERLHRWLFPHSLLGNPDVPVDVDGLRLYHEGRSSYHMRMLAMGMHDRDVAEVMLRLARPGMAVLDVGAHIGYFSLVSVRLGGPGSVAWAFEACPRLVPILRRNIAENGFEGQVHVQPTAIGDTVGVATLFAGHDDSMLSSLHPSAAARGGRADAERVPCTTLDVWAREHGWPAIDLVKVDVEGHEVAVLAGMREITRRNPALVLIVEFNERTLRDAGQTADSFSSALAASGFDEVSLPGLQSRPVRFPHDLDVIRRKASRDGNGRVNLVCSQAPAGRMRPAHS